MLRLRQKGSNQISLIDLMLPPEATELPKDLAKIDAWLDDERFFIPFRDKYHQCLGRPSVPAEVFLRMTALKHQYNLSDREVCAMVTDRISWRYFCRIPWDKQVPHPSSLCKIRQRLDADGSDHMAELNRHLINKAQEEKIIKSRNKVRVDTTVVEANIHHPTDSSLIGDAVRVVNRLARKAAAAVGTTVRDHSRSIKKRVLKIAKVARRRTEESLQEVRQITGEIADIAEKTLKEASKVAHQLQQKAQTLAEEIQKKPKQLIGRLEEAITRGRKVIAQARQVNAGNIKLPDRVVSIFDPDARPIKTGKINKETEFGYKVCLTENKERIITSYRVMTGNPPDNAVLTSGIEEHIHNTGEMPAGVATDRGFWSRDNERILKEKMGIQKVSLPFKGKRSQQRIKYEQQFWFQRLQRWRAGQEGTISELKRRYGMGRTLYRGIDGCRRWVGGAIWGYNLNRIARLL